MNITITIMKITTTGIPVPRESGTIEGLPFSKKGALVSLFDVVFVY
jgi:hypothetical protein